ASTELLSICYTFSFFKRSGPLRDLHSFPTRRSSDLARCGMTSRVVSLSVVLLAVAGTASAQSIPIQTVPLVPADQFDIFPSLTRSEEHTSELQSRGHLVCRPLLEKKKMTDRYEKRLY